MLVRVPNDSESLLSECLKIPFYAFIIIVHHSSLLPLFLHLLLTSWKLRLTQIKPTLN